MGPKNSSYPDLSGLKLVRNPPFDELLARLKEDTVQLARKALQQLPLFQIPSAAKEVSPGLLVRLMLWAFAPKEERSAEGDGAANSSDCQKEIRRRLGNL